MYICKWENELQIKIKTSKTTFKLYVQKQRISIKPNNFVHFKSQKKRKYQYYVPTGLRNKRCTQNNTHAHTHTL